MSNQYNGTKGQFEFIVIFGGVVVFFLGICVGIPIGEQRKISQWREDVIKRGYAEYNATTGQWQWKGDKQEATE